MGAMITSNHRHSILSNLWISAILCLMACQGPAANPPPTSQTTTITFVAVTADQGHYLALAEAFNEQTPGVAVRVIEPQTILPGPEEAVSEETQAVMLSQKADVFVMPELDAARLNQQTGVLYDLAPLLARDEAYTPDSFFPGLATRFDDNGHIWGIPLGVLPHVVYYNPAAFAAAQEPYPALDWTWQDFLAKAQRLTAPQENRWGFAAFDGHRGAGALMLQDGALLVGDDRPTFNDPANVAALEKYVSYIGNLTPPDPAAIAAGQVAMWIEPFKAQWPSDVSIAPLPQGTPPVALESVSAGYISARAANPQAAWLWLDFLSRQAPPSSELPARRATFNSDAYRDALNAGDDAIYARILETLPETPWPWRYGWFRESFSWLTQQGIAQIVRGTAAGAVLQEAQTRALDGLAQSASLAAPDAAVPAESAPLSAGAAITCLVISDEVFYKDVAQQYASASESPVRVIIRSVLSGVEYPPEKRAAEADVFWVSPNFRQTEVQTYWRNLQPLVESDNALDLGDFYPQALAPYRRQGALWGLPVEVNAYLLFYNQTLFDAAGVAYPTADWTWDDLAQTAAQLSFGEGEQRQWGFTTMTEGWATLPLIRASQQAGRAAPLVDNPNAPAEPTLNNPAVVESVRWYASLSRDDRLMPSPALHVRDWNTPLDLVAQGKVALWIDAIGSSGTPLEFDVGVVPLPTSGTPYTAYSTLGYGLSAQREQPQESWRWLVYLTRQPGIVRGAPARRSLLEQAVFPLYPDQTHVQLKQALQTTLATYADSDFDAVQTGADWYEVAYRLYRLAVRETLEQGSDPEKTLGQAQELATAYLACLRASKGMDDASVQARCEQEAGIPEAKVWYED